MLLRGAPFSVIARHTSMSLRGVLTTKQSQRGVAKQSRKLRRGLWLLSRGMRSRGDKFTASGGDALKVVKN